MRTYGTRNMVDDTPQTPDTVFTGLIGPGAPAAFDWGSSQAQVVRFTGHSTAGVALQFYVNLLSTNAGAPSSGSSVTTGTSNGAPGNQMPINGTRLFQIPGGSTGFSVAALSSGYVFAEVWRK